MNDFTKEELILMYHNFAETEFRGTNDKLNSIRQKIQSMIDNYCEHDRYSYEKNGFRHYSQCLRCGNEFK